jgi:hypothetical protein
MEDLMDLPFPQVFEAAKGKDNTPIEYYIVPSIENKEVYLVHFFEREEAVKFFESNLVQWEEYIKFYKKSKLEEIFKQKGWKVKGV